MQNIKRFSCCLVFLLAYFLTFENSTAFSQTGMVEGTIIGLDGNPMIGAMIKIDRKDITQHFEVKTNKKGQYLHAGLPMALYRVSVNFEGKEIYYFDNIGIKSGESTKLDLNLKQEAEKARTQPREPTKEEKEAEVKIEAAKAKHETMKGRFDKGREHLLAKQYEQAVEEFKAASEMDPKQHVVYASLAEAYKGLRKYDEGIQNYTQALNVISEKPDPQIEAGYHMNLALIYALAGNMDNAVAETKKSAELNPATGAKAYFNLGATLVNSGKSEEAISAFQKAIEIDPNNADAQYQLGISLMSKAQITPDGKTVPAPGTVEAFQKYLQLQPNGAYAPTAKNMIELLGSTIETKFSADKEKKKK